MGIVLGKDFLLTVFDGGFYKPLACDTDCSFEITTDTIETSVTGAGDWATFEGTRLSWSVSANGAVYLEVVNQLDIAELQAIQINKMKPLIHATLTSVDGKTYEVSGYVIITSSVVSGSYNGVTTFSISAKGTGKLNQSFVPSPINPPGNVNRLEFTLADGEDTYTNALLIGKKILEVIKGSLSIDTIITTGTPGTDEALYTSGLGSIKTGTVWSGTEKGYIIYQDL